MEQRKVTPKTTSKSSTTFILIFATFLIGHNSLGSQTATITNQSNNRTRTTTQTISVQTSSGLLHGSRQSLNIKNSSVYKFLAVPYAEAPVAGLRFKPPAELRAERAQNVLDATNFGKTCPQYRHLGRFISPLLSVDSEHQISEDCLHLNVFVPTTIGLADSTSKQLEPTRQVPVIVWIPGEGFDFADARQFDGSYLAHKTQSIVVTVQYRVGVFGFLKSAELGAPGNMGLHDQIMALRWVKKNIDSFGGDSSRVSLMGRFSGSMSISALVTAPQKELIRSEDGEPLFSRAIMLSGIAVNDWIIESEQEASKRIAQIEQEAVAKKLCTKQQLASCLQSLPVNQLLAISGYGWRLAVDNKLIDASGPIDAVRADQIDPTLEAVALGQTGQEGTLCLYRHLLMASSENNYAKLIEEDRLSSEDVATIIQDDSLTYFKHNLSNRANPIQSALKVFLEQEQDDKSMQRMRDRYLDACSSYMVKSHSNRFKRNLLARNGLESNRMDTSKRPIDVFHYELNYKPTFSLAPDYIKTAAHGDDVPLIFGLVYKQASANEVDLLMTRKMMSYIGNFVHGNNPLLASHPSVEATKSDERVVSLDDKADDVEPANRVLTNEVDPRRRRSWSGESQTYSMEFNDADLNEINGSMARLRKPADVADRQSQQLATKEPDNNRYNIQVIVYGNPMFGQQHESSAIFDMIRSRSLSHQTAPNEDMFRSRSKHLLELSSKQQQRPEKAVGELDWVMDGKPSATKQSAPLIATGTFVNESSFITILLFSACIVIFALISFCIVLSLIVFRWNVASTGKMTSARHNQAFGSSSSCNICDDSQGANNALESTLGEPRKRGLCSVFTRLRNHHHHQHKTQLEAASHHNHSHNNDASNNNQTELVMHNRGANGGISSNNNTNENSINRHHIS